MRAVVWCLRYPLSYRDIEEMFRERGFASDWTVNDQNDLLARLFGLQKVNKA